MREQRRAWMWICWAAGIFYALLIPRYYVGYYSDDALYIVAAKSLLQGRYVFLHNPSQPPITDPLPGFPLFLAPWVAWVQPHWEWLRWVSWLLTFLGGLCVWRIGDSWVHEEEGLLLLVAFLLNPTTLGFSGVVMSEPCFLFFVLAALIGLERWTRQAPRSEALWVGLGVWIGWAALIRPQGFVLILAVVIGLLSARRWRETCASGLPALGVWGSVLFRNYYLTKNMTGYLTHWHQGWLSNLQGAGSLLGHQFQEVASTIVLQNLMPFPWGSSRFNTLLVIGASGVLFCGAWRWFHRQNLSRPLRVAVGVFTASYLAIHLTWFAVNMRYFLPVLPFLLLFLIEGLAAVRERGRPYQIAWAIFIILWLGGYAYQDAYALREALNPSYENQLPSETFAWLKTHVPPDRGLLTTGAAEVYLYTGLLALTFVPGEQAEAFHSELLKRHVGYLVFRPRRLFYVPSAVGPSPDQRWSQWYAWSEDRRYFQPIFRSAKDHIQVVQVVGL